MHLEKTQSGSSNFVAQLTARQVFLQDGLDICWLSISNGLELLVVRNRKTWSHITGIKPEMNLKSLIAKYALFVAENRVGEFGMEGGYGFGCTCVRRDERNGDSIIGIR